MVFQDRALFLDHDQERAARGEVAHPFWLDRPGQRDLAQRDALRGRVDAQKVERLDQVQPGLAAGDDADAGVTGRAAVHVQPVQPREGLRHAKFLDHPFFLSGRAVACAQAQKPGALGPGQVAQERVERHGRAGLDPLGRQLEADPGAAGAAHLPARQSKGDEIGQSGGREYRDLCGDHVVLGLMT